MPDLVLSNIQQYIEEMRTKYEVDFNNHALHPVISRDIYGLDSTIRLSKERITLISSWVFV